APFRYAAEIVGASGVAVVPAGDSISFTLSDNPVGLTLVNLASTSDSFTVSVSESAGWEVVTPSGAVTLPPGADTTVVATVRPPAGTLPGAFSVIRLRAGSVTDPAVSDSVAIRQIVSVSHQDPNWDGSTNIADVTHLISWLFSAGPDPTPDFSSGDPDCNGRINIADVAFIIGYLFAGGAGPPCQPADPLNP
ncbi:MAG: hypothetical protein ACE5GA_11630, partial [Candidatus Zixiibacteriota bacterium]